MRSMFVIIPSAFFISASSLVAAPLPPPPPGVLVTSQYGIEFSTITNAGNRLPTPDEAAGFYSDNFPPFVKGSVDYDYRIGRTEITAGQWFEFVQAYAPVYQGPRTDFNFTSNWITATNINPAHPANFKLAPGTGNFAVDVSWQYAARYVNWLNSGKANTAAAFENGVYDTSQFKKGPDGRWLPIPTRQPGAKFWIPSIDEWIKAGYYDPNRYGQGLEGYWRYPDAHTSTLLADWPENGGETDAGLQLFNGMFRTNPVASYVTHDKPWGLFDISGGLAKMTDSPGSFSDDFLAKGTYLGQLMPELGDPLDQVGLAAAHVGGMGFRIAGTVPAPGSFITMLFVLPLLRRERKCHVHRLGSERPRSCSP